MKAYAAFLSNPDWFLASFDPDKRVFVFFQTTRINLNAAAFHDGRTTLSLKRERAYVSLDDALGWQSAQVSLLTPHRVIAHISFCGSTLLARSLGHDERVLSYREPQVLIDLANLKAADHPLTKQKKVWRKILQFTFAQFQKSWFDQDAAFVKPSNWVNNLLPQLARASKHAHFVLMGMRIEAYLIANIRGGKSRVAYSLELLQHLATASPKHHAMIITVDNMPISPLRRVLYLLVICYDLQKSLLDKIAHHAKPAHLTRVSKNDLVNNPEKNLLQAAQALKLPTPEADCAAQRVEFYTFNAKTDEQIKFSIADEQAQNSRIKLEFKQDIVGACEWYSHNFAESTGLSDSSVDDSA